METQSELAARLEFETLLADLSVGFINLPAGQIDRQIIEAQRKLCACLGVERSVLWQSSTRQPSRILLTHVYPAPDAPFPHDAELSEFFPWAAQVVMSGRTLAVGSLSELPPEAARDRDMAAHYGTKSTLAIPLSVGGEGVFGMLTFAATKAEREWPELVVRRARIIAQIFANALARARYERVLRDSEERYRSIALNLPGVVYQFYARDDGQRGMHYVDARAQEVLGLSPEPFDTFFDRFAACVAPECREQWSASIQQAIRDRSPWEQEARFVRPTGEVMYLRGFSRPVRVGDEIVFSGVLRDITPQKRAEIALSQRNRYIETILEQAPIGFAVHTIDDGVGRFVSARFEEIYGVPRGSIDTSHTFYDHVWPDHLELREKVRAMVLADMASGDPARMRWDNVPVILRSGETRYVSASNIPLPDQNLMVSTVQDVTARVRAEEELRQTLEELTRLKEQLQHENLYLRKEIQACQGQMPIVGGSEALRRVIAQAQQVATTDSTVLILGETGTGKELLASYLHSIGKRAGKPFITTNIAAIPATLIESELFGREKGAYTGALSRQIGRFEMADGGTIFLDEIGEMPLETQSKLLRVLQSGQIERLGSGRTIRVNVQVIAATNRKLTDLIREGKFREDLFYRLNVFPVTLPPLRDRPEDIPMLVWAFVKEFSDRMGKPIERIRRKDLESLQRYRWPGNVRELRNVVERSMILAEGAELRLALPETDVDADPADSRAMHDMQRSHILQVLRSAGGRIRGPQGAAEILDMKPATLYSLMKRLGIDRKRAAN